MSFSSWNLPLKTSRSLLPVRQESKIDTNQLAEAHQGTIDQKHTYGVTMGPPTSNQQILKGMVMLQKAAASGAAYIS